MANLSANLEDYLEVIYRLDRQVKISAIARLMGVSRPSVTQIISKMIDLGLVEHVPYGDVKLTDHGRTIASKVSERHRLLAEFLRDILAVPPDIADKEACALEHAIGPETTSALTAFVSYLKSSPPKGWLEDFRVFVENKAKNERLK